MGFHVMYFRKMDTVKSVTDMCEGMVKLVSLEGAHIKRVIVV
jgi:hypothetical protein